MTEPMYDYDLFISRLLRMTKKKDKAFKKFIDKNFKSNEIDDLNSNLNALRAMNSNQQLLVKARAKQFEEINDPSKYFPSLLAIAGIVIGMYTLIREQANNSDLFVFISIIVIAILGIGVTWLFTKTVLMRSTAIYFNSIVTNIQYNNEEEKTS
ncbi:hypothetical protein D0439_10110 [Lysinibacillus fusiformis]|uniref:hypothetical protein n=1 Tax=Lysinibacillus fusiformis TaxID=28031 RepID=UPI0011BBE611|nr:hypothetical protein [Lysinibacillus fusiformis]QDZ98964.1 hypothetical protein D0439_10110 [Lysinibacillus fusiformis]